MAQPGESTPRMTESPAGAAFHPKSHCLIDHYLVPRVLHGHVPDDSITEGVDVYATRPEALPFQSQNIGKVFRNQVLWGYFFAMRPEAEAEAAGGSSRNFRNVAGGGRWCWCCHEKAYTDDSGETYAFRTRFAFYDYEDGVKLKPWRMKEYRLNEGAARFRGVAFHPGAANLVVWKVYLFHKVEIAQKVPPMEYSSCDHGEEDEERAPKRIKRAIDQTILPSMAQPTQSTTTQVPAPRKQPRYIADLAPDYVFYPDNPSLIHHYLIPRVLHGRVSDQAIVDGIAEGVDVYATRPEDLPFPSCNHGDEGDWGYFFTMRPAAAAAGSSKEDVRYVAAGGRWCPRGLEKGYSYNDGEVIAFRTRFAFFEDDGKLTTWRAKEYRLNEDAARFRGVAFHPGATNLVLWKVYEDFVISEEEPSTEYNSSDDDDETEE
ncbi:hypothetical protein QOZ80_4BG0344840 [Eleusine coracana subsp. coracana]|nr:hypothetical protein QOZ80_4BG0344840 [Eleusine coracana subsp. coracana]